MNIWKSKSFTMRWALIHCWPSLAWFSLAIIFGKTWLYVMAALTGTVGLWFLGRNSRKLPLVLAAAILFAGRASHAAEDRPKNPAGACVVVIVVIVAGYCYYRVFKACQNLRPRVLPAEDGETNAPPKSFANIDIALWQPSIEYCPCDTEEKSATDTATVTLRVENGTLSIRGERMVPASNFDQLLAAEGLDSNQAGAQFSHNHARSQFSPISFSETGVAIDGGDYPHGDYPRETVLERSSDLEHWQEWARVTAPSAMGLSFTDAIPGDGARFYRIKP